MTKRATYTATASPYAAADMLFFHLRGNFFKMKSSCLLKSTISEKFTTLLKAAKHVSQVSEFFTKATMEAMEKDTRQAILFMAKRGE